MDSYCKHCGQRIDSTDGLCHCIAETNERMRIFDTQTVADDNHIRVTLDFVPISERLPDEDMRDVRVMVISPCYPIGHPMRERIVSAQFVKTLIDATYWSEIPQLSKTD